MITIDAVCALIGDLDQSEVERWIGDRWVLPESSGGAYVFHEVDVARVRLIVELKRELAIDEESIPMVLRLIDQLYALRRRVKAMGAAIEALPPELRQAVLARLQAGATE